MFPDSAERAEINAPFILNIPDAIVELYRHAFSKSEADRLFKILLANTNWAQEKIKYYGKLMDIPRLTAWYGDAGRSYVYSGIKANPMPWTPELREIKNRIEEISDCTFNCVLLNQYRDGRDSVSWHADDEKELGENPIVGSVTFGEERDFHFKHRRELDLKSKITLEHGSFLLMAGATQHNWLHQIPKSSRQLGPRINLTFRTIR